MTATAQNLYSNLLALPEADRVELVHLLFESLERPLPDAEGRAFDAELARRAKKIRGGQIIGHSLEKLFTRLDARLDACRGR